MGAPRRSLTVTALAVLAAGACAAPSRIPATDLHFDPPSESEQQRIALAGDDEGQAQTGTYTDRYGNTYAIDFDGFSDQTLVETIDPIPADAGGPLGAGGPLHREPAAEEEPEPYPGSPLLLAQDGQISILLQWPLPATGVTSLFGHRSDPITGRARFHYGIDLEGRYGQVVNAAARGRVVFAGWNAGHGRMVLIQHPGGWHTSYSHLSQLIVARGQAIDGGEPIAQLGNSGRSTGPHLHFEVTRWGSYYDPLDILGTAVPID